MAAVGFALVAASCSHPTDETPNAAGPPDIRTIPVDLTIPAVTSDVPAAGRRVRVTAPEYAGTDVHHLLYLPTDWVAGGAYPVIVEYAGNGSYRNQHGDVSTGLVEGSRLGYGISGGSGFIWVCLPFVDETGKRNQRQWWGSVKRTVKYCKTVVPRVCEHFGGDANAIILAGFSRGAIAVNFIGLHDSEIAAMWRGFICHSHYDGVRRWPYPGSGRAAADIRLEHLGQRPQWISHERSVDETRRHLVAACPEGRFTFRALPFRNHTDAWVLRDVPLRRELRSWALDVVRAKRE